MGLCVHPMIPAQSCDEPVGFPIRTSPDITPAHGSPRLFAVFHVLLRRLTPRHPPYALSSFLLPDAESFYFHFSPAPPIIHDGHACVSSRFLLLFAMRLERCWLRAPGPRRRKTVSSVEERLFRFGVVGRALGRNEFRLSGREPNQGFGRHQLFLF